MQYILSQEEFNTLINKKEVELRDKALEFARKLIVKYNNIRCGEEYCDRCPLSSIGFYYNDNDPNKITDGVSKMLCKEYRHYSK